MVKNSVWGFFILNNLLCIYIYIGYRFDEIIKQKSAGVITCCYDKNVYE